MVRWSPARWAQPSRAGLDGSAASLGPAGSAGPPTRADLVAGLVQRLADAGADVEGRARRPVPRLDDHALADNALVDQVRVMAADLLAAGAPATTLTAATAMINSTAAAL